MNPEQQLLSTFLETKLFTSWVEKVGVFNSYVLLPLLIKWLKTAAKKEELETKGILTKVAKNLGDEYRSFVADLKSGTQDKPTLDESLNFKKVLLRCCAPYADDFLNGLDNKKADAELENCGCDQRFVKLVNGEYAVSGSTIEYEPDIEDIFSAQKPISEIIQAIVICADSSGLLGGKSEPEPTKDILELIQRKKDAVRSLIGGGND